MAMELDQIIVNKLLLKVIGCPESETASEVRTRVSGYPRTTAASRHQAKVPRATLPCLTSQETQLEPFFVQKTRAND